MNQSVLKVVSLCLCVTMAAGTSVYAVVQENQKKGEKPVSVQSTSVSAGPASRESKKLVKDETVYILAGADGSAKKIIVSDWIRNALQKASFEDRSELSGIENVTGDESYTMNGEHMQIWDADGKDICYQGEIQKEIPVEISVRYILDGKEISAEELAGKSGHLVIRFDYQNNQFADAVIAGKKEKINVPFAMLTGMVLDTDVFSHVEVSSGRLIHDGDRIAVVGAAFPGLQSSLKLDPEKLEIPESVEISADVTNFEMTTTMTVASSEIFRELADKKPETLDDLSQSVRALTDAMTQLMDGSDRLYEGLDTLLEKSGSLTEGIDQLAAGAGTLVQGAGSLSDGAEKLGTGVSALCDGLHTLSSQNETLNNGARQVFETLLHAADSQLAAAGAELPPLTIKNYGKLLDGVIGQLDPDAVYQTALDTVTKAVAEKRPLFEKGVADAVKEQVLVQTRAAVQEKVTAKVTDAVYRQTADAVIQTATKGSMDFETYQAAKEAGQLDETIRTVIDNAVAEQMASHNIQAVIAENTAAQMESAAILKTIEEQAGLQMETKEVRQLIAQNVELKMQQTIAEQMASEAVQKQLSAASESAQSVMNLKTSLDQYSTFYLGLQAYTAGVAQAESGAAQLKGGTAALQEGISRLEGGAETLQQGLLTLQENTPALLTGITDLRDGSLQLSDGLKKLNEEGIQKLADAAGEDTDSLLARVRAVLDAAEAYRNFSGLEQDMDGQVKFIYRTDSISADPASAE